MIEAVEVSNSIGRLVMQAACNGHEDRVVCALETGNHGAARQRFAEAREDLSPEQLQRLYKMALRDYDVDLL